VVDLVIDGSPIGTDLRTLTSRLLIAGLVSCAIQSHASAATLSDAGSRAISPTPGRNHTPPKPKCRHGTTARLYEDRTTGREIWRCIPNAPMR
jgi:hypothetical protein